MRIPRLLFASAFLFLLSVSVASAQAPSPTSLSPQGGPVTGNTTVTIVGTGFTGVGLVTFDGAPAGNLTVVSDTTITVATPSHAPGIVDVDVFGPFGIGTLPGAFTYGFAPTVSGVSPPNGPVSGNTFLTITGSNFVGATSVTVGGNAATGLTVVNPGEITVVTPSHAPGIVDVVVTTPVGTATGTAVFTYFDPSPTISNVAPTGGPISGGTVVTITGTNFAGTTSVTMGGTNVLGYTVDSATQITVVTPAHAAGVVDVVVTNPDGTGTGTNLFTYAAVPSITSVAPPSGPLAGGTTITITGTNFAGAASVTMDGVNVAGYTVNSATQITATTPAHAAGSVDVVVTTAGGTATGIGFFTYIELPTVSSVSPPSGPPGGGTTIVITGTNFTGATNVTIGGSNATSYTVMSATSISATTPAHAAGAVDVVVTTPGGTATGTNLFTYVVATPPTISSVAPPNGPVTGGTSITITGTNFAGTNSVTVGGTAVTGFTVMSATTITATTAAHAAGVVDVVVTNADGSGTGTGLFTYLAPTPSISSVAPSSGPIAGGTTITITGTNFAGTTSVTVGGSAVAAYTVMSATTITATTAARAAGVADVVVTNASGTATGTGLFTYVDPTPTISGVAPATGPVAGGTAITITGTNFAGTTSVSIGGTAAAAFTVVSGTTITATTPAHAAGAADVVVASPNGTATGTGLFTYNAPTGDVILVVQGDADAAVSFASSTAALNLSLSVTGGTAQTPPISLDASTYSVTLNVPAGMGLSGIVCSDPSGDSATAVATRSADIRLSASETVRCVFTIAGSRQRAIEVISRFMDRRNDLLLSSGPEIARPIERLRAAGGAASGVSTGLPLALNGGQAGGPAQISVSTSLSQLGRYYRSRTSASGNGAGETAVRQAAPTGGSRLSTLDVWFEGRYLGFTETGRDADNAGHFGIAYLGVDYVASRRVLIGGLVQYDDTRMNARRDNYRVDSNGLMAGPYVDVRLSDRLFLYGRAAWGSSDIEMAPYRTFTDDFSADQFLTTTTLTGAWDLGAVRFTPNASLGYVRAKSEAYRDSLGVDIPTVSRSLGQFKLGPELSYAIRRSSVMFEPRAAVQAVWNFSSSDDLTPVSGIPTSIASIRGRLETGLRTTFTSGINVEASAVYDGLGSGSFRSVGGMVAVRVPIR